MAQEPKKNKVVKCPECGTEATNLGSGCYQCPKCGKEFSE